ncbi:MAG TPA: NAD(P)/FAD-dependent oxidoreductase [Candidatus Eisenbacteria bacterium]|nr:NAD(P)/FAD-dependent oxidoreductase [Candidatus Eisenbacteria bacterium]
MVIGAGPAGVVAAARAAELGARTTLITRDRFGGMAANDGPVPVRTLAQAARLIREARQLARYGIAVGEPSLDYGKLLARTREVVQTVRDRSSLREQIDRLGVILHEDAGTVRFTDSHTVESEGGLRLSGERIVLCAGGISRRLRVPGSELVATHSDAWSLTDVPPSMIVVGGGMTGLQVASIFHAFGSRVQLFQSGARILPAEDEEVSAVVAHALRASGMVVHEGFGRIESFQATPQGVRMTYAKDGASDHTEAALAVSTVGWLADTAGLDLARGGIEIDERGFVRVDEYMRTSASHVFAAGDITGRFMLAPTAMHEGYVAATNALRGASTRVRDQVVPIGSFTDPEYARVGLTEAAARASHDVVVARVRFDETTRTIIDGQTTGFCKLIADRETHTILGCNVVGERAVDIVQAVAVAMAGNLRVEDLARIPMSYPTYVGILGRAAYRAATEMGVDLGTEGSG